MAATEAVGGLVQDGLEVGPGQGPQGHLGGDGGDEPAAVGLLVHASARGTDSDDDRMADVDEPIVLVAEQMVDLGVRHIPVVADGWAVGVVSMRDVLRVLVDAGRDAATG